MSCSWDVKIVLANVAQREIVWIDVIILRVIMVIIINAHNKFVMFKMPFMITLQE
jgi:hypothetical protein